MSQFFAVLTTPFFEVVDFALDSPGPATGWAIGGGAMLAMLMHFVR